MPQSYTVILYLSDGGNVLLLFFDRMDQVGLRVAKCTSSSEMGSSGTTFFSTNAVIRSGFHPEFFFFFKLVGEGGWVGEGDGRGS